MQPGEKARALDFARLKNESTNYKLAEVIISGVDPRVGSGRVLTRVSALLTPLTDGFKF